MQRQLIVQHTTQSPCRLSLHRPFAQLAGNSHVEFCECFGNNYFYNLTSNTSSLLITTIDRTIYMALQKLNTAQNERLARLEHKLHIAAMNGDLVTAKSLAFDIQSLLRPFGYETRLMQVKNWLYESGIEAGDYAFAIDGLKAVKLKTNKNTRVHLEATALLAIAYLRNQDLNNAEPVIREVLQNAKVITSERKREAFRKSVIERFDQEVTLFSMKGIGNESLDIDEVQDDAKTMSANTEQEIYTTIGVSIPQSVINSLFRIDDFAKKQLPSNERLKLPSPQQQVQEDRVGETLFSSVKRTLYKSLCDPESDIYKAWFSDGLKLVLSKKYITSAVIATLTSLGIGVKMIATSIVALVIKFGIEVYCTHYKPSGVMDLR